MTVNGIALLNITPIIHSVPPVVAEHSFFSVSEHVHLLHIDFGYSLTL
jgi:hypothetical protein